MEKELILPSHDVNVTCEYHSPSKRTIVITMVLSFVLPAIIMSLAMLRIQVWPGGKFTIYLYDMTALFSPIISSLRYLGKGDSSLFLSFFGALGNNALLNYSQFIVDPIIWITPFFSLEQMPNVIYFITLIKVGLCGVGFSTYFLFGSKGKKYPIVILILSLCYSLMSYNIMYSQIILFYNVITLTPLILLGIERIIDGKKGGIYVLCMTLSLYYSIQLSYMVGIFAVLYLIWRLSENANVAKKAAARFVICNILCAGMYMPVLLPTMFNINTGRMKTYNYMASQMFYGPIWDVAKRFLSCQYDTIESGGLPNIFCGTFIPILAVVALIVPAKSLISRIISTVIIIFFMASFCVVPLNQFWHGFNEPNSFPARYSFLLCLYLLILVYQGFCNIYEKVRIRKLLMIVLYGLTFAVTCLEMYFNASYILTSLNIEMTYLYNAKYQYHVAGMKEMLDSIDDEGFYRIGRDLPFCYNDGMLFGYNGIGYFSSMFERNTMEFIGMLGYSQSEHALTGIGGTPVAESILGIKYKILQKPQLFGHYQDKYQGNPFTLQYNENALPLGFLIDYKKYEPETDIKEETLKHNSFAYQEGVLSELYGERTRVYEKINYSLEEIDSDDYGRHIKMRFTSTDNRPVWIYCSDEHDGIAFTAEDHNKKKLPDTTSSEASDDNPGDIFLKVNDSGLYPFADRLSTMCTYLGTFEKGEEVEVEAACVNAFDDPFIVYYNATVCEAALKTIQSRGLEVTEHKNGVIKGNITVQDEDDLLVLTLPNMKGYQVKVDGKRTGYGAYRDALFALMLEPGEHTIEISYVPAGFIPGVSIGLIFLIITFLYFKTNIIRSKEYNLRQTGGDRYA